ncbi:MAG TPA: hypothetical protein VFF50_09260 [Candidatus Deferrimicrobiaceae bacterium]|nr:hypothetical protein [Candidatus Deferrimicrobiaceae bacterium]
MLRRFKIFALIYFAATWAGLCSAQDLRVPGSASAGAETTVSTTGSGKATFYLVGPGASRKSDVTLGEDIHLSAQDMQTAGRYLAILCADTCHSSAFYVSAGKPASLSFIVHPSRVPVALNDAVSGVAFPFDQYRNLVLTPVNVNFQLTAKDTSLFSRAVRTQNGIAWFRTTSGKSAGPVRITASLDDLTAQRALQQVASDPCNLRITGQRTKIGILVQTEPVHDCAGNVLPDGTIVTFTATGQDGKDTVDAPIKQGIARAQMDSAGATTISAASGVVMGNEIRVGAQP